MSLATSLYDALTAINIPKNQAREVVEALEHKMTTEFTTKSDVALLRADIAVVVARLERYEEMTKTEFAAVRNEMKAEFAAVRNEMKVEFAAVREESRSLEYRLVVKLGGLMVTLFGVFTAVISLLR
jgi:hypothetical protein